MRNFWRLVLDLLERLFRPGPRPNPPVDPAPPPGGFAERLLALHNSARWDEDTVRLTLDPALTAAAQGHADWMARNGRLSHDQDGRPFTDRLAAAGYPHAAAGENIASGHREPVDAFGGWMDSADHRPNVLHPSYRDVGFGMATSPGGGVRYWAAVYGRKRGTGWAWESTQADVSLPDPFTGEEGVRP